MNHGGKDGLSVATVSWPFLIRFSWPGSHELALVDEAELLLGAAAGGDDGKQARQASPQESHRIGRSRAHGW